mmetsp:Transcript_72634/g.200431  ORF Transcript_72634/g.200431 Transcript_72634/m.200431 type:complete len:210 (-) Transcript_72634:889-1518(-)
MLRTRTLRRPLMVKDQGWGPGSQTGWPVSSPGSSWRSGRRPPRRSKRWPEDARHSSPRTSASLLALCGELGAMRGPTVTRSIFGQGGPGAPCHTRPTRCECRWNAGAPRVTVAAAHQLRSACPWLRLNLCERRPGGSLPPPPRRSQTGRRACAPCARGLPGALWRHPLASSSSGCRLAVTTRSPPCATNSLRACLCCRLPTRSGWLRPY